MDTFEALLHEAWSAPISFLRMLPRGARGSTGQSWQHPYPWWHSLLPVASGSDTGQGL